MPAGPAPMIARSTVIGLQLSLRGAGGDEAISTGGHAPRLLRGACPRARAPTEGSQASRFSWVAPHVERAGTALAADAHAGAGGDHAALPVRARRRCRRGSRSRCPSCNRGRVRHARPGCRGCWQARPASTAAAAEAPDRDLHGAALDLDRDRSGRRCQAAAGTSNRRAENGVSIGSSTPAATIGAKTLACAPARVTPLWQLAVKAPGQVSNSS